MTPRRAALTAPFRWLIDAVDVGRQQPQVVLGAIAATVLIGLLPSLPQQVLTLAGAPPGFGTVLAFQALAIVFGLLVMPVLQAGVYRILDGAEHGQPVRVGQIFDGFADGSYGRIVGFTALVMLLFFGLAALLLLLLVLVVGFDAMQLLQAWMQSVVALQAEAGAGNPIPPARIEALGMPPGLGAILAVLLAFLPLGLIVALGSAFGLVSVALRGAGPIQALRDGLHAAVVNAPPLLLLVLALALPVLLLSVLLVAVFGALIGLLSTLSPAIGGAVGVLAFVAINIVLTAIAYGFVLNGWRATCDDGAAPAAAAPANVTGFQA